MKKFKKKQISEKEARPILLTGGHAGSTALATIEELTVEGYKNIHWAGPKYSKEGSKAKTFEFIVFPQKGVICHPIRAGRFQRKLTRYSLVALLKIPLGFWDAIKIIHKYKPRLVVSFGGFAAFPLVFVSWLYKIPVIVHEQTIAAGLANRLSIPFAKKIAIARRESKAFFPDKKTVLTGNPLRRNIRDIPQKTKLSVRPCIFVTGGSRGSTWINNAVEPLIPELVKKMKIIHQCSDVDLDKFEKIKNSLGVYKKYYQVKTFYSEDEIKKVYSCADILVGRAGANTVSEIIYLCLPSILIPIPWAQQNEQEKNAKMAKSLGIAKIINQNELGPESLKNTINKVLGDWKKMVEVSKKFKNTDSMAHKNLVNLINDALR